MNTAKYVCRFGQPLLTLAKHVPSSYTVAVQIGTVNVVGQLSDPHICQVDVLAVIEQLKFSCVGYFGLVHYG